MGRGELIIGTCEEAVNLRPVNLLRKYFQLNREYALFDGLRRMQVIRLTSVPF
jgi:hypothetical protein